MKEYIGFEQPETHSKAAQWKIYKLNEKKDWYVLPNDSNIGHEVEMVEKYPHHFILGDTEQEVKDAIAFKIHTRKYGDGKHGDIKCPQCGYWYDINPYMEEDGLNENYKEKITCICGKNFEVKLKPIKFEYEVK